MNIKLLWQTLTGGIIYLSFVALLTFTYQWFNGFSFTYIDQQIVRISQIILWFSPPIFGLFISLRYLINKETEKKALYRPVIFTAILSLVLCLIFFGIFISTNHNPQIVGEGLFWFILIVPVYIAVITLCTTIIVLFLNSLYSTKIMWWVLSAIFGILIISIIFIVLKDGGCTPQDHQCFGNKALIQNDLSICRKNDCISFVASMKKDELVCNELIGNRTDEEISKFNYCIQGVSQAKKDKTICEKTMEYSKDSKNYGYSTKESCYQSYQWFLDRQKRGLDF